MINTLRPSALFRREHCPGSAQAEAEISPREKNSDYASRGTRIHNAIHAGLRNPNDRLKILATCDDIETVELCWQHADDLFNPLSESQKERAIVGIEVSVDLSAIGMDKGTPDFYIYLPGELLILRDWKSGQGWVPPARWNLQLGAYACAIIGNDITPSVDIGILQPAVRSWPDCWKTSAIELSETYARIKDVLARCERENPPRIPGGWCQYCHASDRCRERLAVSAEINQIADPVSVIQSLTPSARRMFYGRLKAAKKIISNAVEKIEELFIAGELSIEGYCIGESRKTRYWADEQKAIEEMKKRCFECGRSEKDIIKPISIPQAEAIFGEGAFKNFTLFKTGSPTIKKAK